MVSARRFEKLFEPTKIGKVPIKNRIAMAPMGILGLVDSNGAFTQRAIDYYAERAYGGVGLIITGVARVIEIEPRPHRLFVSHETLPSLGELTESVHHYGAKIFVQLTAGVGRVLSGSLIDRGVKPVSASAIPAYWRPHVTARELTTEEVEGMVKAFSNAAEIVKAAGIDGIELHGHEGYLFDQFTTAIWNKRIDKYGGNLEDRLRLPIEVLEAIKDRAGKDFSVIYRYGLKHYMKGPWAGALRGENYMEAGRDVAEGIEMAKLLEKAGFDALHVDAGCYDSWYWAHPPIYQPHGCMVDMATEVKKAVNIPVITVGRLGTPELAENILREGKADVIALGRALLADPHWPKKVHEGRIEDIRPCIGCHDGCLYRIIEESKPLSCTVNPATGRERLYALRVVKKPRRILIAGGGIAGMEAARVASIRGDKVILYEKEGKLGGHLVEASVPDFKQDIKRLLDWYNAQLKKLEVEVKLRTKVTPELVRKEKPDKVIIATGSMPIIPNIQGIEKPIVATCIDLLLSKKRAGGSVVVVGGGLVGCETALWLAKQGRRVTIVEMLPKMATGMSHANRIMLLDLLTNNKVELITNMSMEEVTDGGIVLVDDKAEKKTIMCETIALALGLEPQRELCESLRGEISELYKIGDCKEPRKILDAIWDAYIIASR